MLPSPIAVLGTGSMGGAIVRGLLAEGATGLRLTTRSAASAAEWVTPGVVAAVKPAGMRALLTEIGDALAPGAVVVSVAAGVTTATLESALPAGTAVVRAMPNTPAAIGKGVTGLAAGTAAGPDAMAAAQAVFRTSGDVLVVPEDRIDALSAVSGSGPAYVYLLIERMTEAAEALGFGSDDAHLLVQRTFAGALALLDATGGDPAELRRRVTSPGGTTAAAVAEFDRRDLGGLLEAGMRAAIARSAQIAGAAADG